jgi:hypothetical protein
MDITLELLKHGETGTGLFLHADSGVFGDISIIIGQEKHGFGSTISQTPTVDKFDLHILLGTYP